MDVFKKTVLNNVSRETLLERKTNELLQLYYEEIY